MTDLELPLSSRSLLAPRKCSKYPTSSRKLSRLLWLTTSTLMTTLTFHFPYCGLHLVPPPPPHIYQALFGWPALCYSLPLHCSTLLYIPRMFSSAFGICIDFLSKDITCTYEGRVSHYSLHCCLTWGPLLLSTWNRQYCAMVRESSDLSSKTGTTTSSFIFLGRSINLSDP